jgi:hypothetical protein
MKTPKKAPLPFLNLYKARTNALALCRPAHGLESWGSFRFIPRPDFPTPSAGSARAAPVRTIRPLKEWLRHGGSKKKDIAIATEYAAVPS